MAYKKYIKRGGKIYGPYIYHSRRVNGKVISEYRGTGKENKISLGGLKFLWIFLGIIILLGGFYFLIGDNWNNVTGYSVLNLEAVYNEGEPLKGKVSIFLNAGELIPESSKLVFKSGSNIYEYFVRDLISEDFVEGKFFVQDKLLSGEGIGFGVPGEKEIYPELNFILLINSVIEGNDSLISEVEVSGSVSRENSFTHVLGEGETAELKPKSVVHSISGNQLLDSDVNLVTEEGRFIVSTDYSEFETGFGEEYLGVGGIEMIVDVSSLNLFLDPGFVKISVDYLGEEILTLTANLESGEVVPTISEEEVILEVSTSDILPEEFLNLELTIEERIVLEDEFGNLSLEVSEAFSKNGFLTIRYELDIYWIEFTYSDDLDNSTLESFMERDRIKWMKDLASLLSEVEVPEQTIEEFLRNYSIQ
ncbi:MAG: hypothetical protein IIB81_04565 [Nanoarchaeota archaeon]|nr:hypothetical protein [Nanoarchaeota archaeon]